MSEEQIKEERMELPHEAWPGYKGVFYVTITITVIYLAYIVISSLP